VSTAVVLNLFNHWDPIQRYWYGTPRLRLCH